MSDERWNQGRETSARAVNLAPRAGISITFYHEMSAKSLADDARPPTRSEMSLGSAEDADIERAYIRAYHPSFTVPVFVQQ